MKAVFINQHGSRDNLIYSEQMDKPQPKSNEVLVRVRATSLNRIDLVARYGYPGISIPLPHVLGGDICGEIAEIGKGVKGWQKGQRVVVYPLVWCNECALCKEGKHHLCLNWQYFGLHRQGGYSEYVAVPAVNVVALPDNVTFEQGASMPVAGITAYHGVKTVGNLQAGETFLIWGGGGGLGTFAVQIAKSVGATVIASVSTDERFAIAKKLGADHVVNRRIREVAPFVREVAPDGIDLALDYVGPETFQSTFDLLKKGGKMLLCGIITGRETNISLHMTYLRHLSIHGLYLGTIDEMKELLKLISDGTVVPCISDVLPLKDASEGHRRLEEEGVNGKIVLKID